jgi:uncharacterized protein YecE (DUF72 family)
MHSVGEARHPSAGEVLIGPAGWSYDDWKGVVFPKSPPRGFDPLAYLARYFDLIEVNSSFYRPPAKATVASWARRVRGRARFRFTVKLWREFTHGEAAGDAEATAFLDALEPLAEEERLGAILIQFPFWFRESPESRDRLARLADWLTGPCPLCVEVRHRSWLRPEPMTFLHDLGLGFVNIDLPQAKMTVPPTVFATTPIGYVRLHGRNAEAWFTKGAGRDRKYDYTYASDEVDEWVRRVETIRGKTVTTYVVTNNHFRGQAPANALQIMARLADRRVSIPPPLAFAFPALREEGDVEEDAGLF